MSGIVGIWHRDGEPVDRFDLARVCATLRHRGADDEGMRVDGAVGLACCLARIAPESAFETQPAVDASGAVLAFDGRLDNREELLAVLDDEAAVSDEAPDSVLALAAYHAFGDDFPARLNGDFALGLFDPSRQQVLLARDAVGVRPLYYYASRDVFLFASEIKTLLAHPRVETRPNDHALAGFLLRRFAAEEPQESTFFQNVVSVLPAHRVVVTRDGVRTQRYWDFDLTRQVRFARFEDYADAFEQHFEDAVRRRLRSATPVAVSISGGVDSSAIFCVAETVARRDRNRYPGLLGMSHTFPDGLPSDEKAFLLEIEREYGLNIWRLADWPRGVANACCEGIWHAEAPFLDPQWNGTHAFLTAVRDRGARVLLTGHWGDQFLFDDAYLVDLCRRGAWRTVRRHLIVFGRSVTDSDPFYFKRRLVKALFTRHAPDTVVSAIKRARRRFHRSRRLQSWYTDAFRNRIAETASARPAGWHAARAHTRSLYREARSRYHVLCMEWNNKIGAMHGLEMAFPFLDRDLIAFLMAIPGEIQSRNGMEKGILREALRGVLPAAIADRLSKADFTSAVNEGVATDYDGIVRCLRAGGMVAALDYVRPEALDQIARRTHDREASTCEASWAIADLFFLECWLQEFFGQKRPEWNWRLADYG